MQTATRTMPVTDPREADLTTFTFWVGEQMLAVPVHNVLSVTQNLADLKPTPLKGRGLLGATRYRGKPVAIYDLAAMFDIVSGGQYKTELLDILHAREQDHLDWLDALEESIRTDAPFTKARDPHQCAFGKWYDSFTTRDAAFAEILERFDEPHRQIHALADELLELKARGNTDEALHRLEIARNTVLRRLRKTFHHARIQLKESIRDVVLNLTTDGETPLVGLKIDEINDVITYPRERLLPLSDVGLPMAAHTERLFTGYLSNDKGEDCLLIDPEQIIPVASETG